MNSGETRRPTASFVLSLVGGIISIVGAFVVFLLLLFGFLRGYVWGYPTYPFGPWLAVGLGLFIWVLVSAILVIVGSIMMYRHPEMHRIWGIIILVFSLLGGGGILGIIGGALAIGWSPTPTSASSIIRICPQCGRVFTEDVKFCSSCGKRFE